MNTLTWVVGIGLFVIICLMFQQSDELHLIRTYLQEIAEDEES